ncbi:hypothetical protein LWM68_04700 [Niabella sp. W65]|nr:hypothetical protein [Niabella sp. W65]MCH7362130.1 hypothetical protein [Niabella sp. W65]
MNSGQILFSEDGRHQSDLLHLNSNELRRIRGNKISMIFQEPMTSLNPVFTCGRQVAEALLNHKNTTPQKARQEAIEWFEKVKLPDPESIYKRYPHQLSGGKSSG